MKKHLLYLSCLYRDESRGINGHSLECLRKDLFGTFGSIALRLDFADRNWIKRVLYICRYIHLSSCVFLFLLATIRS